MSFMQKNMQTCTRVLRAGAAARQSSLASQRRGVLTLRDHKYTAHAVARGAGRNGVVNSPDDGFELRLATPKALGGKGDGHNPEQLFAMGYSACFLGALQLAAHQSGKTDAVRNAVVRADVHIGEPETLPGFGLAVDIKVEGVEDEELIAAGHKICPYSRALSQGVVVTVSKA